MSTSSERTKPSEAEHETVIHGQREDSNVSNDRNVQHFRHSIRYSVSYYLPDIFTHVIFTPFESYRIVCHLSHAMASTIVKATMMTTLIKPSASLIWSPSNRLSTMGSQYRRSG